MKPNFRDNLKENLISNNKKEVEEVEEVEKIEENPLFVIDVKKSDKTKKRVINIYTDDDLVSRLDKVSRKTKYSRNELIIKMCEFCLDNMKIEKD